MILGERFLRPCCLLLSHRLQSKPSRGQQDHDSRDAIGQAAAKGKYGQARCKRDTHETSHKIYQCIVFNGRFVYTSLSTLFGQYLNVIPGGVGLSI